MGTNMGTASYDVRHVRDLPADWPTSMQFWRSGAEGSIASFHPGGSAHRPQTSFRLLWSDSDLYLRFDVADSHLLCANTTPQSMVCEDSCVEFFAQPAGSGYLNFEVSANGTMLASHIRNPIRTPNGFVDFSRLPEDKFNLVEIHSSIHGMIDPERHGPTNWWIAMRIPLETLKVAGAVQPRQGSTWRANFYKCANKSAMPHFGSWSPIGEKLDFHQPVQFGVLRFV